MKAQINKTIMSTAVETMEKLAFLFSFPDDERMNAFPGPAIAAKVGFHGLFSGSLALRMSSSVLPELAVNMLGLDDEEETNLELHLDAFKELLNVICGNLLPALAGPEAEFSIEAPQIIGDDGIGEKIAFKIDNNTILKKRKIMLLSANINTFHHLHPIKTSQINPSF